MQDSSKPLPLTGKQEQIELCWLTVFHSFDLPQLKNAGLRLKLPVNISSLLETASRLQTRLPELPKLTVMEAVKLLDNMPEVAIQAVKAFNSDSSGTDILQKYLDNWRNIKPAIDGHHLEKMGIPRGPGYRTILDALRGAWLTGQINNPADEEDFVIKLINGMNNAHP